VELSEAYAKAHRDSTWSTADQKARFGALGQAKHIQSSHEGSFDSLYSIELIVGRRRWACEMIDLWKVEFCEQVDGELNLLTVAFNHEGFNYIMPDQLEVWVSDPMTDSRLGASKEVIENSDLMSE